MRSALLTLLFSIACAFGSATIPSFAHADNARTYVDLGDVGFEYGRPYYRYDRTPLFVTYDRYQRPRYYRNGPRRVYRAHHYDPYYDGRVIVRERVVYRDHDHRDHYRHGYRDRYWVDRHGRRHY